MNPCMKRGNEKAVLCLAYCCLTLGLLTLAAGCGNNPRSAEHADVSGQVLFRGKPLPGGQVTFVTVKGGFAANGIIDEDGNYRIRAPLGDVRIGVTNRMLQPRGGAIPQIHPKKAAGDAPVPRGQWVQLPLSCEDPHSSGLTYTVRPGPQTHDIDLSVNPGS